MSDQAKIKEILNLILTELEDLRSNDSLLFDRLEHRPTIAEAQDAKNIVAPSIAKMFSELRKKIEEL